MAKELLCDYKDRLIEKHGYPEGFAEDLAVMTESLAEHFGQAYESTVYDAVMATKYVVAGLKDGGKIYETVYDVLEKEGVLNVKDKEELSKDFLKRSSGASASKLSISYDGTGFHVDGVERVVALPHYFDANNPDSMANISRETIRVINGYLRGYEVDGHTLTVHEGLSTETRRLSLSADGKVEQTFISKVGTGLEEGLIKYEERSFVRKYYDAGYDSPKEPSTCLIAGFLSEALKLNDLLREAQVTKDQSALASAFDSHMEVGFGEFVRRLDLINDLDKKKLTTIDREEIFKNQKTIDDYFASDIAPQVQGMQGSIHKDELMDGSYQTGM